MQLEYQQTEISMKIQAMLSQHETQIEENKLKGTTVEIKGIAGRSIDATPS
jgi:hypothetical protein